MQVILNGLAVAIALLALAAPARAGTLDAIRAKGHVQCGVTAELPGFARVSSGGDWSGLDVDICRALAAAVFDDPAKVEFTPLTADRQFDALLAGEVDVLSRNISWTMARDTTKGIRFAAVSYYDGQGFLVRRQLGVSSALELSGARVCIRKGTPAQANVADFFQTKKMPYQPILLETPEDAHKAYDAGRCDVLTSDLSHLYVIRRQLANPADHMVLPEIASKEPLGPIVRKGDEQWFDIVRWTIYAMINAEELGVTSDNVDAMRESSIPAVRLLIGAEGDLGQRLGLDKGWAYRIILHVGNYGEVFRRNVGAGSELKIVRGVNALWNNGGILYAPPIR